jgi:phage tail-like protein
MAEENQPKRPVDPFSGFRFDLELGHVKIAGFTECTGLELETKVFEYKEGGRNTHTLKFPEQAEVKNIVLKRGLTSSHELFDWYVDVASGTFSHQNQRPSSADEDIDRKISIVLKDIAGEAVKRWNLSRAFPVKWVGPECKATDSSIAFESVELAHEGIEKGSV